MSDNFIKWYRSRFNRIKEDPPREYWDEISAEMDLAEVWSGIDNELTSATTRRRKNRIFFIPLSVLLISTMLFSVFKYGDSSKEVFSNGISTRVGTNTFNSKLLPGNLRVQNVLETAKYQEKKEFEVTKQRTEKNSFNNSRKKSPLLVKTGHKSSDIISIWKKIPFVQDEKFAQILKTENDIPVMLCLIPAETNGDDLVKMRIKQPDPGSWPGAENKNDNQKNSGFFAGTFFYSGNSLLLNRATLDGFHQDALAETLPFLTHSIGINGGYNFSERGGIQANIRMMSGYGQAMKLYLEGKQRTETLKLDYNQVEIAYVWRHRGSNRIFKEVSKNILAGTNFKFLYAAKKTIDGMDADISTQFKKFDVGLCLGYEYEMYLLKRLSFFSALSADIGLRNIHRGNAYEPAAFNRTVNTSMLFRIGARYQFWK